MMRAKATVVNRVIAKMLDLFIVMALAVILPVIIGPLLGFAYSLLADGIQYGALSSQSIGKKLMGLKVVSSLHSGELSFKESAVRNAPVGIATFFAIIPVWGWFFLFLVGIPLMAMEIYLMRRMESGKRLGDVMADTEVMQVEGSIISNEAAGRAKKMGGSGAKSKTTQKSKD